MNYWLINPKSEGSNTNLSDIPCDYVYMGWDEQYCPKFYQEVKQGDVIVITEGSHKHSQVHFVGLADRLEDKCWHLTFVTEQTNTEIEEIIRQNPNDFGGGGSSNPWGPTKSIIKLEDRPSEKRIKSILGTFFKEAKMKATIQEYINLLSSTHNLILTGAPGTGKTYLAKQIAEAMDAEIEFVQFHPSYDYTDFVEGLRPIQDDNGNVGFERKDGVFKAFCAKAIKNYLDSAKQTEEIQSDEIFDIVYSSLIDDIDDGIIQKYKTPRAEDLDVLLTSKRQIVLTTKANTKKYIREDYLKALFNYVKDKDINLLSQTKEQLDELVSETTDINHVDHVQYRWTLNELVTRYKKLKSKIDISKAQKTERKPFVFIIDEINRGEISKIFGELFFSIDLGYRGEKGRVQTQYQNIVEDGDIFKKGFFVPENVYIIGTMNDIDRSVESMDFAFRRRFAFKEVTATDSQKMLDSDDAWDSKKPNDEIITSIKDRMDNLNNKIWHKPTNEEKDEDKSIEGLSSAYHIGASYFLKLANYKKDDGTYDFDKLWEYHLEGLLREYLRGMTDVETKIEELHKAYDNGAANGQQP